MSCFIDREVTPIVVWFYINMLYFPYNAQDLAKVPFEDFARSIFDSLDSVEKILDPLLTSKREKSVEENKE